MSTFHNLQEQIHQFVNERGWEKYHSPKNLSSSIAIEASELLELFQWVTEEESRNMIRQPELKAAMESELADILHYVLAFANATGIDLEKSFLEKLEINKTRFAHDLPDEQIKYKLHRLNDDS